MEGLIALAVLLVIVLIAVSYTHLFLDSLFTATSATCVTGLVVFDTFRHWSIIGQLVILVLIQIGGMGFILSLIHI